MASLSHGQTAPETSGAQEGKAAATSAGESSSGTLLEPGDELYILRDVPEEAPFTGLDLGKVGKKGELSLERMPLESDGELDNRRRGAAGVRLKIPLGKQAP